VSTARDLWRMATLIALIAGVLATVEMHRWYHFPPCGW
jgi:hypothetical protein